MGMVIAYLLVLKCKSVFDIFLFFSVLLSRSRKCYCTFSGT